MVFMKFYERHLLSTDLLRTFIEIVECGNLTIAAGRLNRTQSAISVQLRNLEADLDVELFTRTSKGMTLTDAGSKLLPSARSILKELRQASALFEAPLTGFMRVGLPDDFSDAMLEHVLTEFALAHPGVEVEAILGCTSKFPDAVRGGEMDVAVCSGPNVEGGDMLDVEKIVWAAKKGWAIGKDLSVPLAILDRNCWWRDLPIKELTATGRDYKISFRSSSFASIRSAIRAGFAIGILPVSCVDENMAVLSKADGFPALPTSQRAILVGDHTNDELAKAMTGAIKNSRMMQANLS
jgi:DNA-binding transcriptional LysR family regulator